jgi:hypothetical protein
MEDLKVQNFFIFQFHLKPNSQGKGGELNWAELLKQDSAPRS